MHHDRGHMLILVSKTVFVSVCTPLVAIRFSASAQLLSSGLLLCHGSGLGGLGEVAQEGDRVQIERTRPAKQAQPAGPNTTAIWAGSWQGAVGLLSRKTGGPTIATQEECPKKGHQKQGEAILGGTSKTRSVWVCEAGSTRSTLPSTHLPLTLHSPALRVSVG